MSAPLRSPDRTFAAVATHPRESATWFGSEHLWSEWVLPLGICALATLKTLRLPAAWATTQALVDYSQGFVKRGLPGEVYRLLHWTGFGALQRVMLGEVALVLLAILTLTIRSRVGRWSGNALVPAVFLGSYALSFLVHMVGYADLLNITLAVAVVLVRPPSLRFAVGLLLCSAAVLVHESFLLTQFPVVLFSFAVDALLVEGRLARTAWVRTVLLATGMVLLTLLVSTRGLITPDKAERLHQAALQHRDLDLHPFVFTVLSRTLAENHAMTVLARNGKTWQIQNLASRDALLPVAILLLFAAWRALGGRRFRGRLWMLLLAVSLCPLGMHFLGFDAARWNALSLVNLYLGMCVLALRLPPVTRPVPPAETYASVLVLAIGMASGYGLFDEEDINPYPYLPVLRQHWYDYKYGVAQEHQLNSAPQ